jgi:hypothetical protein
MTMPKLNNDIIEVIAKYLINPEYKLLDWIDINDINYISLNSNPHLKAISMLNENRNNINWSFLSANPSAIKLLRKNQDKINWNCLSFNSSIFTYNYEKIKKNFEELKKEIIAKALHPKRIFRVIEEYGEDEIYNIYFDDY